MYVVIKIQAIDQVIYDVPCLQKQMGTYSFLTVLWLASQKRYTHWSETQS